LSVASERTALITGASSGIGRAMSLELARRGWSLALAARRRAELEAVADDVRRAGGRAIAIACDVGDPQAAMDAVRRAERDLGSLDMVVANAGVGGRFAHASTMTWDEVEPQIRVNVAGAMATLVAAIPIMVARQRGHLVGVSSLAGRRGVPRSAAYCAAKAALSTFLESLRIDLGPSGIRVTDVQPGFVDTPMTEGAPQPMPLKWPADRAARHIVRKLEGAPPVIAFPAPLVWASGLGRNLPAWLYDRVVRAAT
jgi:NAD(P)-dependent dehydrogenase (short-subunit alcohol dehydrogenase family)